MSFINRLAQITPSQGAPISADTYFLKQAIVLTGTNYTTNQIPATANFPITISKGKIRVKFIAPPTSGVNPSVTALFVLYDGTNWYEIGRISTPVLAVGANTPSASIPNVVDRVFEFESDINGIQIYVNTIMTGTNPELLMDFELAGTT